MRAILDSDLCYSFWRSKLVVAAALLTVLMVGAALLAPLIAPHDPYDLRVAEPAQCQHAARLGAAVAIARFLLGTDDQGRDILSTILYGTRSSLLIGFAAVLLAIGHRLSAWAVGRLRRRPHG